MTCTTQLSRQAGSLIGASLAVVLLAACGSSSSAGPVASSPALSSSPAAKPAGSTAVEASPAGSPKPAASAPASPAAGTPSKLVLAYTAAIPTILPEWVAFEAGIFKQNGLNVELTYVESSKGMTAMIAGEVQAVVIGSPETVSAASGGADVVAVTTTSPVYPYMLQVPASIKTIDDLKGKKVGISSFGSTSDIATRVALRKAGLDPGKDVSIIAVGSSANRIAAMDSGAIQGGLAFLPDSLVLEQKGFHTLLDMTTLDAHWTQGSDVFMSSYVTANRAAVQKFVDSIVQAIVRIKKDKAYATSIMKKYEKIDDQQVLDVTYDYYAQKVWKTLPYPNADQFADSKSVLGATIESIKNLDLNKVVDDSFVKNAAERGVDRQ